ncbi:MAG: hypothetical protein IPO88_04620 [Nannocystis sp.]|uniref:hypothetical protein n=1 Tax=Nannocystis sp. TaxID=1962667 RepID=UPI002422CC99|nr:hypothetical protein [Nannocystis sp.]MBK9752785.1 hypothetical protein [Nannocystis sp.]
MFPFARNAIVLARHWGPGPDNTHIVAFRAAVGDLWLIKHNPARLGPTTAEEGAWLER